MKKVKKVVLVTSALALLPLGLFAQNRYEYNGHTQESHYNNHTGYTQGNHQISQHHNNYNGHTRHRNNHNTYCSWSNDYTQHNMNHHNYSRNDG